MWLSRCIDYSGLMLSQLVNMQHDELEEMSTGRKEIKNN